MGVYPPFAGGWGGHWPQGLAWLLGCKHRLPEGLRYPVGRTVCPACRQALLIEWQAVSCDGCGRSRAARWPFGQAVPREPACPDCGAMAWRRDILPVDATEPLPRWSRLRLALPVLQAAPRDRSGSLRVWLEPALPQRLLLG